MAIVLLCGNHKRVQSLLQVHAMSAVAPSMPLLTFSHASLLVMHVLYYALTSSVQYESVC
jgi:hypothetical protein